MATPNLNQLVEQLSKTFDQCLNNALSDPTATKEDKGTSDITCLKSTILDLEHQLKGIRLECMQDKQLSVTESITLLKRDIDIKQMTIEKYMGQLDNWLKLLPQLEQKSIDVLNSPSVNTLTTADSEAHMDLNTASVDRSDQAIQNLAAYDDDNDDDEDVEFEEV